MPSILITDCLQHIAGCWSRGQAVDGDEAIRIVRAFRSPRAIGTGAQAQAVRAYDS